MFPCFELPGLDFTCADGAWSIYFCQIGPFFVRCSIRKIELGAAGLVSLDQFAQPMNSFNGYEISTFAAFGNCSIVPGVLFCFFLYFSCLERCLILTVWAEIYTGSWDHVSN